MKKLIGYLTMVANTYGAKNLWYPLKQKICDKYGTQAGYDIQYLEGKKCHSCNGTGLYMRHSFRSSYYESCYRCYNGWYKQPRYVLLERRDIGGYIFHKPIKSVLKQSELSEHDIPSAITITGYIERKEHKYAWIVFPMMLLLLDFSGYQTWLKGIGLGWRLQWYKPSNWVRVVAHFIRYKTNAYPINELRRKINRPRPTEIEDLPF